MSDDQTPTGLGAGLPELPSLEELPPSKGAGTTGASASGMQPSASMVEGLNASGLGFDWRGIGRKLGRAAAWAGGLFIVFLISAWVSLPTRSIAWRIVVAGPVLAPPLRGPASSVESSLMRALMSPWRCSVPLCFGISRSITFRALRRSAGSVALRYSASAAL